MYAKKNSGMKVVATLLAIALLIGGVVGGTVAWLLDTTPTVTNTFTVGDVNIELKEHDLIANGTLDANTEVTEENTYKIVPGDTQPKDPFVRVIANSEDSWIFVQVQEVNNAVSGNDNASKYVTWAIADGWTQLGTTENGVSTYYRTTNYTTLTNDTTYNVLKGDATNANGIVTYDSDLTKANLDAVTDTTKPQLIFKAFAVQAEAAGTYTDAATGAAAAWNQIDASAKLGYVAPNP